MHIKQIILLSLNLLMLGFASWGIYVASESWFFSISFIIGYVTISLLIDADDFNDGTGV